ncbi:sigmaB [tvarminne orthoreovirus]|uniref:SigmaB n=1 Tax=tvarminne orthoreovirus TaxID=3071306 RepID=X5CT94_9REOV|nr:sigmaB [tvarminne orthoreovirus]
MEVRAPNFHSVIEAIFDSYNTRPATWNAHTEWKSLEFHEPDVIKVGNAYCCAACCGVLYYGYIPAGQTPFPHHRCHQQNTRFTSPFLRAVKVGRVTDLMRENYAMWLTSLSEHMSQANDADDLTDFDARVMTECVRSDRPINPEAWKTAIENDVMTNAHLIYDAMSSISTDVLRLESFPSCFMSEKLHTRNAIVPVMDTMSIYDVVTLGRPARLQPLLAALPIMPSEKHDGEFRLARSHTPASMTRVLSDTSGVITSPVLGGLSVIAYAKPEPTTALGTPVVSSGKKAEHYRNIFTDMAHGWSTSLYRTMIGLTPFEAESRLSGHHRTMLDTAPLFMTEPATPYGSATYLQMHPPRRNDVVTFARCE